MFEVVFQGTYIPLEQVPENPVIEGVSGYSRLVIYPLKTVGCMDNNPILIPCNGDLASLWRVYGQRGDDTSFYALESLKDFPNESAAFRFSRKILANYDNLKEIAYRTTIQE